MDDETILELGTHLSIEAAGVHITMLTSAALTPEMSEHVLVRMRRQLVAAARQLGLTETSDV